MTQAKVHPRAKPGCKACLASVSGVCVKHAAVDVEDHPRRCNGINEDGNRCRKWGTKDSEPALCMTHHSDQEQRAINQRRPGQGRSTARRADKAAGNALEMLGRDYEKIDSLEKLEAIAAEALDFMAFLREQMKVAVALNNDDVEKTMARYVTALDRTGKLLETFSKQGLQEREIRMREELVGVVTGLFNQILASFIPVERQPDAQAALSNAVLALEPQKALTA